MSVTSFHFLLNTLPVSHPSSQDTVTRKGKTMMPLLTCSQWPLFFPRLQYCDEVHYFSMSATLWGTVVSFNASAQVTAVSAFSTLNTCHRQVTAPPSSRLEMRISSTIYSVDLGGSPRWVFAVLITHLQRQLPLYNSFSPLFSLSSERLRFTAGL